MDGGSHQVYGTGFVLPARPQRPQLQNVLSACNHGKHLESKGRAGLSFPAPFLQRPVKAWVRNAI